MSVNNNLYECQHCFKRFTRNQGLQRHLKIPSKTCAKIRETINEKNRQTQQELNEKMEELNEKMNEKMEEKLEEKDKTHLETIKQLVHTKPGIRNRKQALLDIQARNEEVVTFEDVIANTEIPEDWLRETVKEFARGDLKIFEKYFFKELPRQKWCFRIRDAARDRYQYFDGTDWITVPLKQIAKIFCEQMWHKYQFLLREKHSKLAEVNEKWPCSFIDFDNPNRAKNQYEFDLVSSIYQDESRHAAELLCGYGGTLRKDIVKGLRPMFSKYLAKTKKK